MSRRLLIALVLMLNTAFVLAQDPSQVSKQESTQAIQIRRVDTETPLLRHSDPLFVINADDKTLQIPPAKEPIHSFSHSLPMEMNGISANWIKSITVLKDQQATEKYGELGQYGVVIIELKDNVFDAMPAHLAEKFKIR
ncbi:MAG TPA: hypothetical protein VF141_22225 [Chryseolinea sp.]